MSRVHALLAFAAGVLALCLAGIAAIMLDPVADRGTTLLPLVTGVVVVTALAGPGAGLAGLIASAAFAAWYLFEPRLQFAVSASGNTLSLALYTLMVLIALLTVTALRVREERATRRALAANGLIDALADGVLSCDARGRVRRLNRAAERLTGWRNVDAQGKPVSQVLRHARPGSAPGPVSQLPGAVNSSFAPDYTLLLASDGSTCPVTQSVSSLLPADDDGGHVYLLHDVSEWQRSERELRGLIGELWAAGRDKDEALAVLAARARVRPEPPVAANDDAAQVAETSPGTKDAPPETSPETPPHAPLRQPDPITQPFEVPPVAEPECRVLMLSEDNDSTFALTMLLGMAGYDVKTANSSPDALRQAARFAPAFAVIDTSLPGEAGLEAARALRRERGDLELIALTDEGEPDQRALRAAGFAVALPKAEPLALKRWLAKHRAA